MDKHVRFVRISLVLAVATVFFLGTADAKLTSAATAKPSGSEGRRQLVCLYLEAPLPIHIGKMKSEESKAWTGRV